MFVAITKRVINQYSAGELDNICNNYKKSLSRGGWQRRLEPSLHDRPSKEIGRVGLCTNFIPNKHGGGEEGELAELAFNLFGVRAFVLVRHYFRYSKFKHSREGFDRFFF